MKLFSRMRRKTTGSDGLSAKLLGRLVRLQMKAADWLNLRTKHYSVLTWRMLFALFCLCFGGTCIYLILISIH